MNQLSQEQKERNYTTTNVVVNLILTITLILSTAELHLETRDLSYLGFGLAIEFAALFLILGASWSPQAIDLAIIPLVVTSHYLTYQTLQFTPGFGGATLSLLTGILAWFLRADTKSQTPKIAESLILSTCLAVVGIIVSSTREPNFALLAIPIAILWLIWYWRVEILIASET